MKFTFYNRLGQRKIVTAGGTTVATTDEGFVFFFGGPN